MVHSSWRDTSFLHKLLSLGILCQWSVTAGFIFRGRGMHRAVRILPALLGICVCFYISTLLFGIADETDWMEFSSAPTSAQQVPWDFHPVSDKGDLIQQNLRKVGLWLTWKAAGSDLSPPVQFAILIATHHTQPELQSARLVFSQSGCIYSTGRQTLQDNRYLNLRLEAPCQRSELLEQDQGVLSLEVDREARISLWTKQYQLNEAQGNSLRLDVSSADSLSSFLIMRMAKAEMTQRIARGDKLAYLWGFGETSWPLFSGILLVMLALWVCAGSWLAKSLNTGSQSSSLLLPLSLTLLMGGLIMAVIVPPFHAPDEPDHFLSSLTAAKRQDALLESQDLAKRGHFERIKFHNAEIFRSKDVAEPMEIPWGPHVEIHDPQKRSLLTPRIWSATLSLLPEASASRLLISMRGFNMLFLALAVFVAIKVTIADTKARPGAIDTRLMWPLLLMPVVSFFAMHVSDFSLPFSVIMAVGVFFAGTGGAIIGIRSALVIGIAFQMLLWGPHAFTLVLPLLVVLLSILLWRSYSMSKVAFPKLAWLAMASASIVTVLLYEPTYAASSSAAAFLIFPALKSNAQNLSNVLFGLLSLAPVAMLWVCYQIQHLGSCLVVWVTKNRASQWTALVARSIGTLLILTILVLSLSSLWFESWPMTVDTEIRKRMAVGDYIKDVLAVFMTWPRLSHFDFYLQQTLLGGFGWLESIPRNFYLAMQNLMLIVILLQLGAKLLASGSLSDAIRWMFSHLLVMATLAAFTFAVYQEKQNLHGRYILSIYFLFLFFLLGLSGRDPKQTSRASTADRKAGGFAGPLLVSGHFAVYGYVFSFLLQRYLGT